MNNLNRNLLITMPDGSQWAVPIKHIASHRANTLSKAHISSPWGQKFVHDTTNFMEVAENVHKWASGHMNWEDVSEVAWCVKQPDIDFQDGWMNGSYELS